METNRASKTVALLLAVGIVFTMLPTVAFAKAEVNDTGSSPGMGGTITAFVPLEQDVAVQKVEAGTEKGALNLPDTLVAVFSEGSDASKETRTTVAVSGWSASPAYSAEYNPEGNNTYTFTPALNLLEGVAVARGVEVPTITVMVEEAAPMARGAIPIIGPVTGTMDIGGKTNINLASNQSGTGWAWNAATATLTLAGDYVSSNAIFIFCATTDTINLEYSGDVTIRVADVPINCRGALNVNGNGTLTLENTTKYNNALQVISGDLNISSGTLIVTGSTGIYCDAGNVTIGGSANVTTASTGSSTGAGAGISANVGYGIFITGGTVKATGKGQREIDGALIASNVTISGGDVTLSADKATNYVIVDSGAPTITGWAAVKIEGTGVYLATLKLDGISTVTPVSAVTASVSKYAIIGKSTSADGKLCFLLPAGNQTVTLAAGGNSYAGTVNVTTDNAATALLRTTDGVVAGTMKVGGETGKNLMFNQAGTGWAWNAAAATLTLDSSYSGKHEINILCAPTDNVTLVLTGDVTINATDWGINVSGGLTIRAGSHTLDVASSFADAIQAEGGIAIESGTLVATGGSRGSNGLTTGPGSGNISITGRANVTAIGFTVPNDPDWSANGIQAAYGNVVIDTSGVVNAMGGKGAIMADGSITVNRGTVTANGGSFALLGIGSGTHITGGVVTTNTTGTANGNVWGNLNVSGPGTRATVNGDVLVGDSSMGGDLTVSGGTVTVTGTVEGNKAVTGGTVSVNGQTIPPSGGGSSSGGGDSSRDSSTSYSTGVVATGNLYSSIDVSVLTPSSTGAINEVVDSATYNQLRQAVESGYYPVAAFDVRASSYSGRLTLSFPVGAKYNGMAFVVKHKTNDGTIHTYTGTVENGKAVITVNSLSPFMVAIKGASKNPNTGR